MYLSLSYFIIHQPEAYSLNTRRTPHIIMLSLTSMHWVTDQTCSKVCTCSFGVFAGGEVQTLWRIFKVAIPAVSLNHTDLRYTQFEVQAYQNSLPCEDLQRNSMDVMKYCIYCAMQKLMFRQWGFGLTHWVPWGTFSLHAEVRGHRPEPCAPICSKPLLWP